MRPQPEWLISDDAEYRDIDLGRLKTGKEADVFLIERTAADRSCLLAHKRYRPRSVSAKGELAALGFQRASAFANDAAYRAGTGFAKSRDRRAAARGSAYGKRLHAQRWIGHELEMLEKAWEAGVTVPYPVGARGDGLLMQFIGDIDAAAPRLAQARLSPEQAHAAFAQVVANLRLLVGAGIVHADLSAYNLLWWRDEVWFIDLPQAVDVSINPHAFDFLQRDVTNVCRWFARQGVDTDATDLFVELITGV